MQTWTRPRYYAGRVKTSEQVQYAVFSTRIEATEATHGHKYSLVFGPYRTRTEATEVGSAQGYGNIVQH